MHRYKIKVDDGPFNYNCKMFWIYPEISKKWLQKLSIKTDYQAVRELYLIGRKI